MKQFFRRYGIYFLLAGLAYFPIFGHLDEQPIRLWDEARVVCSSYEMMKNGNYLVSYYDGHPEMWSVKPPFLNWIQVISMRIFGVNALAVRLPSAFAALFTIIAVMLLFRNHFKKPVLGIVSGLVLLTAPGFIGFHASRTGDYDAMLVFFTTIASLLFFLYFEKKNARYLYGFFFCMALGVLTKSVMGLMLLPGFFLYSLLQKEVLPLLKSRHFYLGILVFLLIVLGFYLGRESVNPGYLQAVWENELGGRYLSTLENHNHPFHFYHLNFYNFRFPFWYTLIPCGIALGLFSKEDKMRRISLYALTLFLTYLLIVSYGKTKLNWYELPVYPFMSILVGIFIYTIYELLNKIPWTEDLLRVNVLPYLFLFILFLKPYNSIFVSNNNPQERLDEKNVYVMSYFLQEALRGKHDVDGHYILYDGPNTHILFYKHALKEKGIDVEFGSWENLKAGDRVILSQGDMKKRIETQYKHEQTGAYRYPMSIYEYTLVYKILGKGEPEAEGTEEDREPEGAE